MKISVDISMGEYYDKLTILKIKQQNNIGDGKELKMLLDLNPAETNSFMVNSLGEVLLTINQELWEIEDSKRQCEKDKDFENKFVQLSRLVYMLNDMRANVKKQINQLTNSDIIEYKSHE
tara:strand:+ start:4725 stop:5084 length:360 start_codon:yes stop_codon:yes gene_type:complete